LKRLWPVFAVGIGLGFATGFVSHVLYQRWTHPLQASAERGAVAPGHEPAGGRTHPVRFEPTAPAPAPEPERPLLEAREVEKIRALSGRHARIRGRIFRVGHSAKSNTYFLNFGPTREALTAVIFASAVEQFEKTQLAPKDFAGREVEISGEIKNHPQYGLEVVLENPSQIRILN
jgi:hypothetical protein